jgi:hypothetical protein
MGDSAPIDVIRGLMRDPRLRLFSFIQADAYTRKFTYLNKMTLPRGGIDLGKNLPARDVQLVGPTVELVAREDLDPALTELLLEAAAEVHGGSGMFKKRGEFPSPEAPDFVLSPAAAHFYKSGKSLFYRLLPFGIARFVDRALISFVPLLVLLIPGLKLIPAALRWRINLLFYRWYRLLLRAERDLLENLSAERRETILDQLDEIEGEVNRMKVPAPYATQFYELRGHINFVRAQLQAQKIR